MSLRVLGGGCAVIFVLHSSTHLLRGAPHELLWACILAPLLMALGAWTRTPRLAAIGVLWLSFGTPLWLLSLWSGGEFIPASLLSHCVAPILGVTLLKRLHWPSETWWRAAAALGILMGVTRWLSPGSANVNLAFAVAPGWEARFPRHDVYAGVLMLGATATFWLTERLLKNWAFPVRRKHQANSSSEHAIHTAR